MKRKLALSVILFAIISATVVWLFLPENRQNVFSLPSNKEPLLISRAELYQYTNETLPGKILCAGRSILTPRYIYVMNANEDKMTRLTKIPSNGDPAWSPDGKKFAESSCGNNEGLHINSSIFVTNADGTNRTRLTFNSWGDYYPVYSPDGTKIAFFRSAEEESPIRYHLYVMNAADGSDQRRLTKDPVVAGTPHLSWSPDSKRITYDSEENIYVVDLNGNITKLAENTGTANYDPAWSPDGKKIAYFGWSRPTKFGAIYTINPDDSNRTMLTAIRGASSLIWSRDGTRIAFVYPPDVNSLDQCICTINATGGNPIRVSKNYELIEGLPDWSPDGKWIVFGAEGNIHIAKADGSIEIQLTKNETMSFFYPVWSSTN